MTPLAKHNAIDLGFKQLVEGANIYQLDLDIPYSGRHVIEICEMPHRWMGFYMVNGICESELVYTLEDLQALHKLITGELLKKCH